MLLVFFIVVLDISFNYFVVVFDFILGEIALFGEGWEDFHADAFVFGVEVWLVVLVDNPIERLAVLFLFLFG